MPVGASSLQVRFEMREPDGNAERRAADRGVTSAKADGAARGAAPAGRGAQNRGEIDAVRQRIIDTEFAIDALRKETRYASGTATLIDTSFTMSLGETVVVGTSRMRGGGKALIVLLTAVTRRKP